MADLANLVLAVDSTQVKAGTASLDGLADAGARAEAATLGLGRGSKTAAADGLAMASAAQASARAAMDQAAGFGAATNAARLNTLAMRETLVVGREISRGNWTRLPGSLTLLAQGIGSQGGIGAYASAIARQLGLIRQVQNAELAEAAAAAANAAAGVEAAARRAAANVMAADTEIALAEAQLRVTEGTSAEAVAQIRLAAAHEAVGAAAAEAAVAENALAAAMGRSAEIGAASAAATRTLIGGAGVGLLGIATVAGIAFGAVKQFQDQVKDDGTLTDFRDHLGLTHAEMLKLSDGVDKVGGHIKALGDVTVTFGDVFHGVWGEIKREANDSSPWHNMGVYATSAFSWILTAWDNVSAGITAGLRTIQNLTLNLAAGWHGGVGTRDTSLASNFAKAKAENAAAFGRIKAGAIQSAEDRLQAEADALKADRTPKKGRTRKESDHGLQEALDKLDAEIKGQYALADAYGVSDAAAQRATAHQKAAEDAVSHKASADLFYAKELQKAVAEDVARQAKSNAAIQVETSIRAQLNGQLADGTLTVAQYNDQLKLQTTLHKLNVDLENADAQHKGAVRDIIKQTIDLENEQLQLEAQLNALKQIASNDNDIARLQLENSLMGASNKERAVAIAQLEAMQRLQEIDPNGLLTRGQRNDYVQSAINKAAAGVQTPFQQWAKDIPQTAAAITDALQTIEFKGFDALASSIADVVTGTKSLGAAFRDISHQIINDIIQMTVKMLIFRAISGIFGGAFNFGASGGYAAANSQLVGGLATGGPAMAGKTYLVGEKGPELFRPSTSGLIVPNNQLAANNNQGGPIEIKIGFGDAPGFAPYVQEVSSSHAKQAVAISINHTNQTLRSIARPKLGGG